MRKLLLIGAALAALCGVATAQVNVVPQTGLITSIYRNPTYSAISLALAPASSATDIFCISGSTTKTIHVTRIGISGTAGTLVSAPFTLLLRHSLDSGGTAASTTANPANTLGPLYPSDPAPTATLIAYSANPTINDTSPAYVRSAYLSLPTTSANIAPQLLAWKFGTDEDFFNKGLDIPKGTTDQYCINLNSVSVSSGVLDIDIEWTEY